MKKFNIAKKLVIMALAISCLIMTLSIIPVSAANGVTFTKIDLSQMTYANKGTDTWELSTDSEGNTILAQTSASDTVALSNVTLEPNKAYTAEVKVRFIEPWDSSTASKAAALLFGVDGDNPWVKPGKGYCAMIDRGRAGEHKRIFAKNYSGSNITAMTKTEADDAFVASTEWHTIRVTITETNLITLYVDGVLCGQSSDETGIYNGGRLGVLANTVKTRVEFKDLCYTDCVTEDPAVFETAAIQRKLTIHYKHEDGTAAAEDSVTMINQGEMYNITSPAVEGYIAETPVVSGKMEANDVEVTVVYKKTYTLTVHYVKADGSQAFDDYVLSGQLPGAEYSVDSLPITHYTADQDKVFGTMPAADTEITVTYNPKSYNLTIKYVDADGNKLADDHTEAVVYGNAYSVESPVIEGYTADKTTVADDKLTKDTEIEVKYTKNAVETTAGTTEPTEPGTTTPDTGSSDAGCAGFGSAAGIVAIVLAFAGAVVFGKKFIG